ncbi:MAG: alpha/beta hydrolase [Pseudomonadota bacterium]
MHYLSHDGLQLYYRIESCDSALAPVICLPGLTRNGRDFEDLAAHLAHKRSVILPDLRGRGFSDYDPHWRNYHPQTYVNDVWSLLDKLQIDQVVVVGTSLGGLIAMIMAGERPQRLAGVVLNDVGPDIDPVGLDRIKRQVGKLSPVRNWTEAAEQARMVYGHGLPEITDNSTWLRLARRGYRENADGIPVLDSDPNIGRALAEVGAVAVDQWHAYDALRSIPTLLIRGARSDILAPATVDKMRARKRDLAVAEIPNRGHVPLLDEPESLTAIDQFLENLS